MRYLTFLIFIFLPATQYAQQNSVLSEGEWVKMSLKNPGMYRINYQTLKDMGFDPDQIDPKNIAIYGLTGGKLPQANSTQYPSDLIEMNIKVLGEEDGVFNENDLILFYADAVDDIEYLANKRRFRVEKNPYAIEMHYFLTIQTQKGKRIKRALNLGLEHPAIHHYSNLIHHEDELRNLLQSGRAWFGELIPAQSAFNFRQTLAPLKEDGKFRLEISAMAQAFVDTKLNVGVNDQEIGELSFSAIPDQQYGIKGNEQSLLYEGSNQLFNTSDFHLSLNFDPAGSNNARAFLNKITLELELKAHFDQNQELFRLPPQTQTAVATMHINTTNNDIQVWNVKQALHPEYQDFEQSEHDIKFGYFADLYQEYVIFQTDELPIPNFFEPITNQNLSGSPAEDFLIITHPLFESAAQRLAQFREQQDGLKTMVVTPEKIYNEYSGGRQDVSAIRNFIRHQYQKGQLKYVLMFGKGSYDYRNIIDKDGNFVPTYESRNSLHPLLTFSSDDYFGFLEDDEGEWEESRSGDHSLDIGIGRIPATSIAQAETMVDKIIHYQTQSETFGSWRSRLVFVADDGDFNIHQRDADQLATAVDDNAPAFETAKIYLDQYRQERLPNGERSKAATKALTDAVNKGALVVNFTGHGSETTWMQEQVLTFNTIEDWQNPNRLPFVITATCEFGRNDDAQIFSGAEKLIFQENGGAIGMLTTARPVFASSNFALNQALYNIILKNEGGYPRLGDIIKFTKNNALRGSLNRNFILLGDPSMRLAYPKHKVEFTTINEQTPSSSDTLKAMQPISLTGKIVSDQQTVFGFNGSILVQLIDKAQTKITLGSDNPPFEYQERDQVLFKGRTEVKNGLFELQFTIPKNIDYSFGRGKLMAYAFDTLHQEDALGSSNSFTLGGTFEQPITDVNPPQIQVFLNDTLQPIQGLYPGQVLSIIQLSDDSGINISQAVPGQNITLTLNDSITEVVTHLWEPQSSDGTRGQLIFPWSQLPQGTHTLTAKAWDIFGNPQTETVHFAVSQEATIIYAIKNYPNPFINETTFEIIHNLVGSDLEVLIEVIDAQSKSIVSLVKNFVNADSNLRMTWNRNNGEEQPVGAGIYLYQIHLTSKTNGIREVKRGKMIISN